MTNRHLNTRMSTCGYLIRCRLDDKINYTYLVYHHFILTGYAIFYSDFTVLRPSFPYKQSSCANMRNLFIKSHKSNLNAQFILNFFIKIFT